MPEYYSKSINGFVNPHVYPVLPIDTVEVSQEEYTSLLVSQAAGKAIVAGPGGRPVAADRPLLSGDALIKQEIVALESQQTPRRIREATLGIDNGWLAGIEAQIEALRAQLGAA